MYGGYTTHEGIVMKGKEFSKQQLNTYDLNAPCRCKVNGDPITEPFLKRFLNEDTRNAWVDLHVQLRRMAYAQGVGIEELIPTLPPEFFSSIPKIPEKKDLKRMIQQFRQYEMNQKLVKEESEKAKMIRFLEKLRNGEKV